MSWGGDWRVSLGRRMRERRLELGLTQDDVAERLGLADNTPVSNREAGKVTMRLPDVWATEQALGLERGELLQRAGLVTPAVSARQAIERDARLPLELRRLVLAVYDHALGVADILGPRPPRP